VIERYKIIQKHHVDVCLKIDDCQHVTFSLMHNDCIFVYNNQDSTRNVIQTW